MPPPFFPPEKPDLTSIIKPTNAQAVIAALDPAFAVDPSGLCCVVPYSFNRESLLVAHLRQLPSAGLSSLDIARAFASFIAEVRAKVGATWLPTYCAFDCTKDRTVADRLVELGLGGVGAGVRSVGGVRFPALTGVLFGGMGAQPTEALPLFVTLPGRGRYAVRALHVPKVLLYTGLREKLALQHLKIAAGASTPTLLAELENLEAKITAARHVSIQPAGAEEHDDLADALALGVFLAREYEVAREDARRRGARVSRPAPTASAWT
jgi:hypothetical protein